MYNHLGNAEGEQRHFAFNRCELAALPLLFDSLISNSRHCSDLQFFSFFRDGRDLERETGICVWDPFSLELN